MFILTADVVMRTVLSMASNILLYYTVKVLISANAHASWLLVGAKD